MHRCCLEKIFEPMGLIVMEQTNGWISRIDQRIDAVENKLKQKEFSIPMDLVGGVLMAIFAVVILLLLPSEIKIKESDVVNGRAFPTMLMIVMLACSLALVLKEGYKLLKKQEVKQIKLNLLVELKAVTIFAFMLIFYFVCQWTGIFAVGACTFALLMMLFFRCKKWNYYAITIAAGVLIWVAFRYGLNVRF